MEKAMSEAAYQETTTPLMNPTQVEDTKEQLRNIEGTLSAPPHIANQIQDRAGLQRQLIGLNRMIETQAPVEYRADQKDAAVQRAVQLLSEITVGMPTQEEMRRRPSGAVDKHRNWEHRNKAKILEWKNIRRRMHVSGMIDTLPDAREIANLEVHRPTGGSQELNMHGELIAGKSFHMPAGGPGVSRPFDDERLAILEELSPELFQKLALLDADARDQISALIDDHIASNVVPIEPEDQDEPEK